MDKNAVRANQQKAFIQDSLRAALKDSQVGSSIVINPFIVAIQTLKREISFMEPFLKLEQFSQVEKTYKSAIDVCERGEKLIIGENEVAADSDQLQPLVQYHANLLKIHRLLLVRVVEGSALIPPAPPTLKKQVEKAYESIDQLKQVIVAISQIPKPPKTKKQETKQRKVPKFAIIQEDDPLVIEYRVSPFITEGPKKSTVSINGVLWSRYV